MVDEVFVSGLTTNNAILLLAEAEKQGLGQEVVRATENGFLVPESLVGAVLPQDDPDRIEAPEAPQVQETPQVKPEGTIRRRTRELYDPSKEF